MFFLNLLIPLFSSASHEFGVVFDKLNLRRNGIGFRALLFLEFSAMLAVAGGYILFANVSFPPLASLAVGLLLATILLSFAQNIFELKGIQAMQMNVREPISNLQPILTGVVAYLLFPSEGNIWYLVAIIVGVFVIVWSTQQHFSWRHLFASGSGYVFADISLSAVLDNLAKFTLLFVSPAYLSLFRIGGVLVLFGIFLRPQWNQATSRNLGLGVATGILFGVSAITRYFAIQELGLNFTLLVMMLGPGMLYLLSYLILKERFSWRPVVGSVIIVGLIVFASIA